MQAAHDTELRAVTPFPAVARARVQASSRLHLGFLDPAGSLGRPFGSLGLAIDAADTVVELAEGRADTFDGFAGGTATLERALRHVEALRHATGCRTPVNLRLRSAPPAHVGLGSGTQLALAVGRAFCVAFGMEMTNAQLAATLGRGARSGVGIAGFDRGGLLLDGGPRADGAPAALLARIALPAEWRVLVVLDARARGLSGADEKAALSALAPLPREAAAEICHQVLMRILPGAAGGEFAPFAAGVSRMQELLGQHFAPAQAGRPFTSEAVGRLLQWIGAHAAAGTGQSSWGPTGFAFLPSEPEAHRIVAAARDAGALDPALEILVVRARNHGALVSGARKG
ncbi:MAG TPA: beta-ribofuranosylaminobenzene 5'-phosphate synthase family protein [Ramlibacter sp.]|uniref:beta-ribofuranosylaminobenzene 5'-phosphate synthase family protein n=1 Tax=Ramlibacter sp. TaxID=1917967 RepID=UPI002ED6343D